MGDKDERPLLIQKDQTDSDHRFGLQEDRLREHMISRQLTLRKFFHLDLNITRKFSSMVDRVGLLENRWSAISPIAREMPSSTTVVEVWGVLALHVPVNLISKFMLKKFKDTLLTILNVPAVLEDATDNSIRKILLNTSKTSVDDISHKELKEVIVANDIKSSIHRLELSLFHFKTIEILQNCLPEGIAPSTSFESIGHIAHVNLREEQLPFKYFIGWVVLNRNKNIRTVLNKVGNISNQFRVFDMEVLAGEKDFITTVKEHGCSFKLDYSKVYWNSRLLTEHQRLVDQINPSKDVLCDLFCGIGPFAIPAAKKGVKVYANDLNPESFRYLKENIKLNKVSGNVKAFNKDAREFFKFVREQERNGKFRQSTHFVMNYPKYAIEFLDIFRDAYKPNEEHPMVHCHCFFKEETEIIEKATSILGLPIREFSIHKVRLVSPSMNHYCFSFRVPNSSLRKKQKT